MSLPICSAFYSIIFFTVSEDYIEYVYNQAENENAVKRYLEKQEDILNRLDSNLFFHEYSNLYISKARFENQRKNLKGALTYLFKSLHILQKNKVRQFTNVYLAFAQTYESHQEWDKASYYYELALENAESLGDLDASFSTAKFYSDFLLANNLDREKAQSLIVRYAAVKDSLDRANKYAVDEIYKKLLKDKEADRILIIYKYGFALFTLLYILYYSLFFFRLRKLSPINFNLPKQSEKYEIRDNNSETDKNFDIKDLIEMAKNNNPEFLFVFGSIYPEVMSVFRELAPNMRNSEIYFLALCYLNFTPKEIAKCTNVTVRAVQVRKNRYRKKFNIPSDTDFNLWIYDLNKGHKES